MHLLLTEIFILAVLIQPSRQFPLLVLWQYDSFVNNVKVIIIEDELHLLNESVTHEYWLVRLRYSSLRAELWTVNCTKKSMIVFAQKWNHERIHLTVEILWNIISQAATAPFCIVYKISFVDMFCRTVFLSNILFSDTFLKN